MYFVNLSEKLVYEYLEMVNNIEIQKYITEAIKKFINYAFCNLNLDGLELDVYNFNSRAVHCYEKVGFKVDGKGKTIKDIHMKITK